MDVKTVMRLLNAIRGMEVVVFGDIMLDRYIWGRVERVSPEAPVQVVEIEREEEDIGGAGNVLKNLLAWGARPVFIGCVGDDEEGEKIKEKLLSMGLETDYTITVRGAKTTSKTRIMAESQQILRIDRDNREPPPENVLKDLKRALFHTLPEAKGLIVSDYRKGTISRPLNLMVPRSNMDITVDPKREDLSFYSGASFIKPNAKEFSKIAAFEHLHNLPMEEAGNILVKRHNLKGLLLTMGKEGMLLFTGESPPARIRGEAREVYDVTGAGDTVISIFSLLIFAGTQAQEAAHISNRAASVAVGKVGAKPVSPREVFHFLKDEIKAPSIEKLKAILSEEKRKKKKIAMTSGFFDLIHPGQILFLKEASRLADILVVAINSDESTRRLKGNGRPILSEDERIQVLTHLPGVDYVVVFDEDHPGGLIRELKPDIYVKGKGIDKNSLPELEALIQERVSIVILPELCPASSGRILERWKSH